MAGVAPHRFVNGLPEAAASAILVLLVVAAVRQIKIGRGKSKL